jgi:ATP-dependent DNA ligase
MESRWAAAKYSNSRRGEAALKNVSYPVLRSTTLEPADLIRAANELQLEGVIAKRKGSLYQSQRNGAAHG